MEPATRSMAARAGLAPGEIAHAQNAVSDRMVVRVIEYGQDMFEESAIDPLDVYRPQGPQASVLWVDAAGVNDLDALRHIGSVYELHPLVLEDIQNTGHRAKCEDMGSYVLVLARMVVPVSDEQFRSERVSFILGDNYVLSFQEQPGDVFDAVRERLRMRHGHLLGTRADMLLHALLDAVIDFYFVGIEQLGDDVETVEEAVIGMPDHGSLQQIHTLRRLARELRHACYPLREAVGALMRIESSLIKSGTRPYLRDLYEHSIQLLDTTENLRDALSALLDIYLSGVSNRMNEVMRVLTVISTLFIPLTFIAGVYGMNFAHMPELGWKWGYAAVWGLMASVAFAMLLFFRRRNWL